MSEDNEQGIPENQVVENKSETTKAKKEVLEKNIDDITAQTVEQETNIDEVAVEEKEAVKKGMVLEIFSILSGSV